MALIPSLLPWVKGSSIAAAAAWIQSLTQELPCATGVATKKKKKRKKDKEKKAMLRGQPLESEGLGFKAQLCFAAV